MKKRKINILSHLHFEQWLRIRACEYRCRAVCQNGAGSSVEARKLAVPPERVVAGDCASAGMLRREVALATMGSPASSIQFSKRAN